MFTLRWWHVCMTDMSGPGPAFSWIVLVAIVLVAILGSGLVALGLLTAGQFVRIGPGLLDSGNAEARALASAHRPRSIQPHYRSLSKGVVRAPRPL